MQPDFETTYSNFDMQVLVNLRLSEFVLLIAVLVNDNKVLNT